MKFYRHVAGILEDNRYESSHPLRREKAAHVFEANPMGPNSHCLPGSFRVILIRVARRDGIDQIHDRFHPHRAELLQLFFEAWKIVPAGGRSRERNTVCHGALDKKFHHRGRQLHESAGSMHAAVEAQAGAPKTLRPLAHPFPRILFLLANVFLDHRGAEKFQRLKPRAIHCLGNGEHRPRSHPQRPETLLPVAQGGIDKMNFAHG